MTHVNAPVLPESNLDESVNSESGFAAFDLAPSILKAIETEGFSNPTAIQQKSLPPLMDGNDLMGIAQTGGGKTAAFSLPTIHKLISNYSKPRQNMPKVLILAPTRELAMQIEQCIMTFSKGSKISSLVVAGGQPYPPQTNKLRRGVDILVATPGRLIDHIKRNNVKFNDTETFILDEADRMLDMGFIDDVQDIADSLPESHQTIFFSATMNQKVRNLSKSLLTDPVYVEIEKKTMVADTIAHKLMNVTRKDKAALLADILAGEDVEKALVFARTKIGADELSDALYEKGIRSDAIHGDKRQRVREKILMNFRRGRTNVLVATDVAARGIDVDGITHVINYELPIEPENYVHRVGRTGRAGAAGIAISFCDPSDMRLLVQIEQLIKIPIEVDASHAYHIDIAARGRGNGGKGGGGRFSRDRAGRPGARREGGFSRDKNGSRPDRGFRDNKHDGAGNREERADRPNAGRFKAYDNARPARDRDERKSYDGARPERSERKFDNNDRPVRAERKFDDREGRRPAPRVKSTRPRQDKPVKKEAQRYDPWQEAKQFSDDPVLGKLLGKPPKFDSKKEDKSDFVKTGAKKSFKKVEDKPAASKKIRGGKKTLTTVKSGKPNRPKVKNNGGTKTFSPKRKPVKTNRAA
ncbi:DEAD/DEAH box helicase [Paremcibacter congregatus]|uniref:DEAD/DEAH box helicase n=1 Tax=Paremcibacter congregatus TaxID=2043170 RepID=UPI003A938B1A